MQPHRRLRIQWFVYGRWIATAAAASLLQAVSVLAVPTLPIIPANTFTVPTATGNAATDTSNIINTISAAANAGGGTVVVPAGTFLSNQFPLTSNINLHLNSGTIIRNNVPTSTLITTSGTLHDVEITGSGIIDGRAANTTSSNVLVSLRHITNVLVQGVTIQNSSHFHLVVEEDNNLTIDGININDNYTVQQHGTYLANTDAIDYSGSHILIENSNINSGDDDIVAKPQSTFCSDINITNNVIGAGHGISVGGQTSAGLDGMTVSHVSFTGTDNGLRLKSGAQAINPGGGGVVKNVVFSDITMTNVKNPIIINSWYNGGDHYGSKELSGSALHDPLQFDPTNPGDPTVQVNQNSNTTLQPFYDNISFTNITATGGTQNVAIIYGLNSIPANPSDPLRNIDDISFHNVNLSGAYGADIYYSSNLDLSGLTVTAANGNAINLFGDSLVIPGDFNHDSMVDVADYVVWRKGLSTIFTQSDYDVWRAHFGQTAGGGSAANATAAVPEPATVALLVLGILAMSTRRTV